MSRVGGGLLVAAAMSVVGCGGGTAPEQCATRLDGTRMCGAQLRAYCRATDGARGEVLALYADDPKATRALLKAQAVCDEALGR